MGFEVVEGEIRTIWAPLNFANSAATVYQGSIVMSSLASSVPAGEGLLTIGAAAGASDTTGKAVPFGVVLGFNAENNGTYSATYKSNYVVTAGTQASQQGRNPGHGAEGMVAKGDPLYWAKVAVIGTNTVLKGRIFNGAYGTACTTYSNTTASTDGSTLTTSAISNAYLAYNGTWYCRSGANMGLYRTAYDTSTTSHTFYTAWPQDLAVGDSFVLASLRIGTCAAQFDSTASYIEQMPSYATNYYLIDVLELNLSKSGEEYAIFKFNADQFCAVRA